METNAWGIFVCDLLPPPHIPIPDVSQSSLPGATNIEQKWFGSCFLCCCVPPIRIPSVSESSLLGANKIEKVFLECFLMTCTKNEKWH